MAVSAATKLASFAADNPWPAPDSTTPKDTETTAPLAMDQLSAELVKLRTLIKEDVFFPDPGIHKTTPSLAGFLTNNSEFFSEPTHFYGIYCR